MEDLSDLVWLQQTIEDWKHLLLKLLLFCVPDVTHTVSVIIV